MRSAAFWASASRSISICIRRRSCGVISSIKSSSRGADFCVRKRTKNVRKDNDGSMGPHRLTAASFSARICLSPFFFLTGAAAEGAAAFFPSSSEDASQSSSASSSSSPSNLLFLDTMGGASVGRAVADLAVVVVAGASLSETSSGGKSKGQTG